MGKIVSWRGFLTLIIVLTLFSVTFSGNAQAQSIVTPEVEKGDAKVQAYYVWYASGQRTALRNQVSSLGGEVKHVFAPDLVPAMVVLLPEAQAKTLLSSSEVTFMEPVPEHWLLEQSPVEHVSDAPANGVMVPTNPQVVPWNVDMVQARDVWDVDRDGVIDPGAPDGSGVKFCIIDTGFYRAHDDFQGIVSSGWSQITGENWYEDGNGHGTHVAGTANAVNNTYGVVGVMPGGAQLLIVKIFNNSGVWVNGQSNLGTAAQWCRDNGANAISMSLGGSYSATEDTIFQNLYDNNNMISIAAAGNDGNNVKSYPGSYDSVISVAALQKDEVVASFSQFPPTSYNPSSPPANVEWDVVELSGGGDGVLSTVPYLNGDVPLFQITTGGDTKSGYHIEEAAYTSGSGITALLANGDLCGATNAAWSGKVVLCQRGTYSFAEKVNAVRNSGGVGVVIYNNVPGDLMATCGGNCTQPSIPAISLNQVDGQALLPSVGSNSTLIVYSGSDCTTCTGGYDYMSGTSMATPGVAAGVAWVWDSCGGSTGITNKQLRQLLRDSAKDLSGTRYDEGTPPVAYPYGAGYDVHSGWGLIQLKDALVLGNQRFGSTCPLTLLTQPPERTICTLSATSTNFNLTLNDTFVGTANMSLVNQPAGSTVAFVPNPVIHPVKNSVLTLGNLNAVAPGSYTLEIKATNASNPQNVAIGNPVLGVYTSLPQATTLTAPAEGSNSVSTQPTFSWSATAQTHTYDLQIATDPGFASIVHSVSGLQNPSYTGPLLAEDTVYYWRVRGNNPCGIGDYSAVYSFRTQVPPTCSELIGNGTFESGNTVWTESPTIIGEWGVPHLGTWYAFMGGYKGANDNLYQTVSIPAGATGSLTYWYYISSTDSCGKDYGGVRINGVNSVNYNLCTTTNMTGYAQHSIPLDAYSGTNPEIRFWATTNNAGNDHSTLRVDDVSLVMCIPPTVPARVCGNLPGSYGMACHRALTGSTLQLGAAWGTQDGVTFGTFVAGQTNPVTVNVQGTPADSRYLRLWFDWDGNGVFDETERVHQGIAVNGANTINVSVPASLAEPVAYRVRLYDGQPVTILAQDSGSYGETNGGDIADGTSPSPVPTAILLSSFSAVPQGESILLTWETAAELQNLGFNIYRGESFDGPWTKLNATLIPAQNPGATFGAKYEWLDTGVTPEVTYSYRLEDVDLHGASIFHGPVSATASGVTSVVVTGFGAHGVTPALMLLTVAVAGALVVQRWQRNGAARKQGADKHC